MPGVLLGLSVAADADGWVAVGSTDSICTGKGSAVHVEVGVMVAVGVKVMDGVGVSVLVAVAGIRGVRLGVTEAVSVGVALGEAARRERQRALPVAES